MAEGLIKFETIDAQQIKEIMSGREPSPPDGWEAFKVVDKDKDHPGGHDLEKDTAVQSIVDDPI